MSKMAREQETGEYGCGSRAADAGNQFLKDLLNLGNDLPQKRKTALLAEYDQGFDPHGDINKQFNRFIGRAMQDIQYLPHKHEGGIRSVYQDPKSKEAPPIGNSRMSTEEYLLRLLEISGSLARGSESPSELSKRLRRLNEESPECLKRYSDQVFNIEDILKVREEESIWVAHERAKNG